MKKITKFSILLLLLIFYNLTIKDKVIYEGKDLNWENIYKVVNVKSFTYRNRTAFMLKENEYEYNELKDDLVLHFNAKYKEDLKINGSYKKNYISYIPDIENKKLGYASANFSLQHHKISLLPLKNSIFYPGKNIHSFEIDFWIYPQSTYEGNEIFSYYGPAYIKKYNKIDYAGFKCYISGGKLKILFANVFYLRDSPVTFEIDTNLKLDIGEWQHIAISYDSFNGKFIVLKNNKRMAIKWITEDGKENSTLLIPKITEYLNVPFEIGKSFFGNIDEFHIGNYYAEEFNLNKYISGEGEIISKVIDYKYYSSIFKNFRKLSKEEKGTNIYIFARDSETVFKESNTEIPWKLLDKNTVLKGRYLQWKIILYPSYSSNFSPYLYDFYYYFSPNTPPSAPINLKYKLLGKGKVLIIWDKNIEEDVIGYYVYYGKRSRFYIDNDAKEGPSPVFTKNNSIILTLKKFVQYYISVKAVDNAYKPQRSKFSKEIIVRPE